MQTKDLTQKNVFLIFQVGTNSSSVSQNILQLSWSVSYPEKVPPEQTSPTVQWQSCRHHISYRSECSKYNKYKKEKDHKLVGLNSYSIL